MRWKDLFCKINILIFFYRKFAISSNESITSEIFYIASLTQYHINVIFTAYIVKEKICTIVVTFVSCSSVLCSLCIVV